MTDPTNSTISRLVLFDFANKTNAFADLAFNLPQDHGAQPRLTPLNQSLIHIDNLGCKSIIRQHTVQDPDFFAEYYAYYSRMFGDTGKYCHRFHFFTTPIIPDEDVLDFIDRNASDEANNYLGFITIRPVRSSPMAASILRPLPNHSFLLSSDEFDVHLGGRKFVVRGTPFMQQDNAVGACAQASIWMALRTLRKKEGNSAFDPAQITGAATRFLVRGRTLPNREGLGFEQMIEAIRFAGYSPHIMHFGENNRFQLTDQELLLAKRKIYAYVESEIPVVLGVYPDSNEGHAIVLIGHKWDENNSAVPFIDVNGIKIYHAADWATCFIAHNDNTGPYIDLLDSGSTKYCLNHVRFAIPLLPSDVFITGEEAEGVATQLLFSILLAHMQSAPNPAAGPAPAAVPTPQIASLVFRTYLIERHNFREWVTDNPNIHASVKRYYRLKAIPKRIWVTEINLYSQHNDVCSGSLSRVGEIVIDPTGEPNDTPFLSIHLNIPDFMSPHNNCGVIIDRDPDSTNIKVIPIPEDTSYSPLCR